jgi:hypothetical protein
MEKGFRQINQRRSIPAWSLKQMPGGTWKIEVESCGFQRICASERACVDRLKEWIESICTGKSVASDGRQISEETALLNDVLRDMEIKPNP